MEDSGTNDPIPLPNVSSKILAKVIFFATLPLVCITSSLQPLPLRPLRSVPPRRPMQFSGDNQLLEDLFKQSVISLIIGCESTGPHS